MKPGSLYRRYEELQRYVGWTHADVRNVQSIAELLQPHFADLIEDFYAEIDKHPDARKVITGGAEQVQRLKGTLHAWLKDLVTGPYDQAYVTRRWRIGWRHVEIGLDQVYTNVALSRLRSGCTLLLLKEWVGEPTQFRAILHSFNKLLDLDLTIIEDAYQAEYIASQQRVKRLAAIGQAERLAAIGEVYTGLAHESRNALQRSQSCLERLAKCVRGVPGALDLIDRIQKAQDHLHSLYEEVRSYAAPLTALDREPYSLGLLLRQTWENLAVDRKNRDAKLVVEATTLDLRCRVDPHRIEQVFRNVLENALSACPDPVVIRARWVEAILEGQPALEVRIFDNGPGFSAEARRRIFEPFYTTKTKGTGLGMAITRRIVEAHGGTIRVGDDGPGAEIIVVLPRTDAVGEPISPE